MRLRVLLEKRVSALTLLQEKRVSALTVYFFVHVKTLYLRFDALYVYSRSRITFRVTKRTETKIERLHA